MTRRLLWFVTAVAWATVAPALAQSYPTKSIRLILSYPPGGATDTMGRLVAKVLSDAWSVTVVPDNRPGASGNIGTAMCVKAPPDGYTMCMDAPAQAMASRLSRPISALAAAAPALGRGEPAAVPADNTVDEVAGLSRALAEAATSIREREQALRAADRAKDEFLAMLGHELRNPLASLSNAAEILKRSQAERGSYILIPGGTTHDFQNRSPARAGFMSINVPGGFERQMPAIVEWFAENPPGEPRL